MMSRRILAAALCGVLPTVVACGGGGVHVEEARSSLSRNTAPQVPEADAQALATGNTAFAVDLFRAVRGQGNTTVSPHSVSLALAMTWAGARGETEQVMAQTLRFSLPPERQHAAFNGLDLALASRGQGAQGKDGKPFRLVVSNAAWGQKDYAFAAPFLDTLAVNYGAGINLLDFVAAPEESRETINRWVEEKTEDRIQDLLQPGTITSDTRLVLTNAVYFNASWQSKFDPKSTQAAPFTLADGSAVSVPTMRGEVSGAFAETAEWQAAELPYDGGETSLVVVVPRAGTLDALVSSLDGHGVQAIAAALRPASMMVSLPKFSFEFEDSLKRALEALGMGQAFGGSADFSGIDGQGGLAISDVIHKTFVAVDEEGTEAAAATAVILGRTAAPGISFAADRPFLFFIRDVPTGAVLFLGQVADPR